MLILCFTYLFLCLFIYFDKVTHRGRIVLGLFPDTAMLLMLMMMTVMMMMMLVLL